MGFQALKSLKRSPHFDVKVMSVGSLLEKADSAIIWRGPRKTGLIKQFLKDTFWGRLDFLIFDTPPGTSDEHLTVVKALKDVKPDGAVVVSTPQDLALATIRKELNFCRKMGLKVLGIVENMSGFVCPHCQECSDLFSAGGARRLADEYGFLFLGVRCSLKNLRPLYVNLHEIGTQRTFVFAVKKAPTFLKPFQNRLQGYPCIR
ncbi:cytosolic Fe-S cluster assembly factor NUBP2-like [Montipora capricornis]|uniref:cytosolic Fe-S cluster assembly factor NUBP2-like n=1 Tax=Montipora capricornis TaxID=246305 RepID=UPI0035F19060